MRIIGKIKDYYDGVQAFGQDQSVIFLRSDEELSNEEIKNFPILHDVSSIAKFTRNKPRDVCSIELSRCYILFCGKMFHAVKAIVSTHNDYTLPLEITKHVLYTYSDVENFVKRHGFEFVLANTRWRPSKRYLDKIDKESKEKLKTFFAQSGNESYKKASIESKWSVVTIEQPDPAELTKNYKIDSPTTTIHVNGPSLKNLQFYKIKTPEQAYQELDMWISGVLASSGNPMVEIEDKYRIPQHGFDKKSFRKEPTKKK